MKPVLSTLIMTIVANVGGLTLSTASQAQTVDPTLEWATRVVALQQSPGLNRLVCQSANSSAQDLLQKWGPKLQASISNDKRSRVTDEVGAELQRYPNGASQLIGSKVGKVNTDAQVQAYMEKFTLADLQQGAALFESPAAKKYQASASVPVTVDVFIRQLVEATHRDVSVRTTQFDETAAEIIAAHTVSKALSLPPGNNKPAPKK